MNTVQNIMMDVEALLQRIREELAPHPRVTQARQFIEGAKLELEQHPDASEGRTLSLFDRDGDKA